MQEWCTMKMVEFQGSSAGKELVVICYRSAHEETASSFFPSRQFVFIRGSIIFLKVSAPRGRVALPVEEARAKRGERITHLFS
jgi:hypothetical protein